MSTAELKNSLHQMIDMLDDKRSSATFEFVQQLQQEQYNQFENLSAAEIAAVTEGRLAIKNGKYFTLEEFNQMRMQWRLK